MSLFFSFLALVFLFFIPGHITARALFRTSDALSSGEKIFLSIAISILISLWFGLVLAELGWFSLAALCALAAIYSALIWFARRKNLATWALRDARLDWIFIAILLLGAVLDARPAEYVLGGYDAGIYVNVGANIARTGAIAIHDSIVQTLPLDVSRQFFWDLTNPFMLYTQVRLPGFFVADSARGLVLPQFLHLYPIWLAIFDAAFGVQLGLYATPVLGLLGSVAAYFVGRTLFGKNIARLAFFLLVINVPQFWFARYPVSETLMQFLMLTGLYAFLRSSGLALHKGDDIGFPLVAGVAFAEIFLARSDAVIMLAPLSLYLLAIIFLRQWRRAHSVFLLAFGILLGHAFVHIWFFAPDYIYYQYTHVLRMKNIDHLIPGGLPSAQDFLRNPTSLWPLAAAMLVGLLLLFVLDRLAQFARRRWGVYLSAQITQSTNIARWLGTALVLALFVLAYFVWPHPTTLYAYVGGETTSSRAGNLIKLGWYLSPFGLVLAVFGAMIVLRRDLNRHNAIFFGMGALFTLFYIEELYSTPHYIYTVRHYIPLVIPFLILLAARGLGLLWNNSRRTRVLAGGALALWLLYSVYAMGLVDASRAEGIALRVPFITHTTRVGPVRLNPLSNSIAGFTELGGAFTQIQALAEQIEPNAVIIFSNNRDEPALLATPLRFLYGRDALVAKFNQPNGAKIAALIDTWRAQGRPVILAYGTNGGKLALPNYDLMPFGHFALDVPQWAFSYTFMPRTAWRVNLNYALYRVTSKTTGDTSASVIDFGGDDYPALVNGFLERATGAPARWIGRLPALDNPQANPKTLSATLRIPAQGVGNMLELKLVARGPQDGTSLALQNSKAKLSETKLTREFATYTFSLPRASLRRDGDTLLIDLITSVYRDPDGRLLGAELKQARVQ